MEVSVFDLQRAESHMVVGYSFMSNEYGLGLDNVAGYELVLPNGTAINVTSKDEDLWFGLRVSGKVHWRQA